MPKRTRTAPILLSMTDDDGNPIQVSGTLDQLVNTIAQTIRRTAHAQHMAAADVEALTQIVVARLSMQLRDEYATDTPTRLDGQAPA